MVYYPKHGFSVIFQGVNRSINQYIATVLLQNDVYDTASRTGIDEMF